MAKELEAPKPSFPADDVTKDALSRLVDARAQKGVVEKDLQEAYFFTRPRLSRQVRSTTPTQKTIEDVDDLATGLGSEVSEDFATELISAFFPQNTHWVASSADSAILEGVEEDSAEMQELRDTIGDYDRKIFAAINASNFNSELAMSLDPDASIGTVGWWIDAPGSGRPYKCEHVPARELEINVGPDGDVDDRFRVRFVSASKLRGVVGTIPLPEKIEKKIKGAPKGYIEVVWCFWRDWSKPADDVYKHVLLVDKIAVHETTMTGEGCLPLIVARFSPDKLHAWGNGSAIKSLQELRVLDVITAGTQDRVDIANNPPIGYPDDGVIDFEGGIEAGKAYPMRPGSGRDVTSLYFAGDPNLGYYTLEDLEKKVRRKFFADYPEQKGDTPPSATQWLDEMVRSQRRIGTPGMKFWREGPYHIFRRFEYLLEKDGKIAKVKFNGNAISLTPNNPATQAQDAQKLQTAGNLLGSFKGYFPVTSQAAIDERATMDKMKTLAKDEVIVLRDAKVVEQLVSQVLNATVQQQGGGGGATET